MKSRIDKLLVERGLAPSRERAQALILAGKVLVNGQKIEKPGTDVESKAELRLLGEGQKYVSRGGQKLERALEHWKIDVRGRVCMDVGTSTGGFTDCLLQHGAARVIAVDTGYGQIDLRLRTDSRVRLLERTNARHLKPEEVGEAVDFLALDVSFISATLVLPAVIAGILKSSRARAALPESRSNDGASRGGLQVVVLVKPQFEAGREAVGKGGIVRDAEAQAAAVEKVKKKLAELGFEELEAIESPIVGREGNRESLLHGKLSPESGTQ